MLQEVRSHIWEKGIAAWLLAAAVALLLEEGGAPAPSVGFVLSLPLFFFLSFVPEQRRLPALAVLCFGCTALTVTGSFPLFLALTPAYFLALRHAVPLRTPRGVRVLALLAAAFCAQAVLGITLLRYMTYSAPNFDFGIFCNIFHRMRTDLLPLASCERDRVLSHFAVHLSPALYLFLPFYAVFPSPITIIICQVAAVYSGIFPLLRLSRSLSKNCRCLLAVVFFASASLAGSCLYDFHENCLLVPLLLWVFCFYEEGRTGPMLLCAALTLLVKEDAFIYIAVFGVYVLLSGRRGLGIGLAVGAAGYFLLACHLLNTYGLGIMSNRYDVMIPEGSGLLGILKTVFFRPAYTGATLLSTNTGAGEKLFYCLQLLTPLAFLPFFQKRPARLVLVLPICLNLLTDYVYQYDLYFQYSFGITAFLLYAAVGALAEFTAERRRFALTLSAGLSVLLFCAMILPRYTSLLNQYIARRAVYAQMDAALERIPDDASVCASCFLLPHLAQRELIFETAYHGEPDTDYLVLDGQDVQTSNLAGYELVDGVEGVLWIYRQVP